MFFYIQQYLTYKAAHIFQLNSPLFSNNNMFDNFLVHFYQVDKIMSPDYKAYKLIVVEKVIKFYSTMGLLKKFNSCFFFK